MAEGNGVVFDRILKQAEEHSRNEGIALNPDRRFVDAVINGLVMHEEKNGKRYCPCRPVTGNKEEDDKIICPCAYHLEEIKNNGKCHCSLFVRKE